MKNLDPARKKEIDTIVERDLRRAMFCCYGFSSRGIYDSWIMRDLVNAVKKLFWTKDHIYRPRVRYTNKDLKDMLLGLELTDITTVTQ